MSKQSEKAVAAIKRIVFESDEAVVVALTGGWGEGKTHFWKNQIALNRDPSPLYVSVFGAVSLQAIRERVAMSTIPRTEGAVSNVLKGIATNIADIVRSKIGIGISDSLMVDLLERTRLKAGQIVCIDDVERLSAEVGFETFLGYVTELRDQRKLKVVLIFNNSGIDSDLFQRYREKVIDREIPFALDFDEVVSLVFRDVQCPAFDIASEARSKAEVLGLRNIRILVKARRYFQEIVGQLPDCNDADFLRPAFGSLLLFVYTKFEGGKPPTLTFEMLQKHNDWTDRFRKSAGLTDDEEEDASADPAKKLLERYAYMVTDEVDRFLIDFVKSDVLDIERLRELYSQHRQDADKDQIVQRHRQVWDTEYHGTFANNTDALGNAMEGSLSAYLPYIPPNELDSALVVLSVLGRDEAAFRYFEDFKRVRGGVFEALAEDSMPMTSFDYPPLKAYFDSLVKQRKSDTRAMEEVLDEVFERRLVSQQDAERLDQFSVDELVQYLTSRDQPKLTSKLRLLAKETSSEPWRQKVLDVAEKIAEMSLLNRFRLEGIGLVRRKLPRSQQRLGSDQ